MGADLGQQLAQRPRLKFVFLGGKGGVGKTVAAAGLAYHFARSGGKTLLASLNPVHSLSSLFRQELGGGKIRPVAGVASLDAVEVDTGEIIARYRENIAQRVREFLKWADIPVEPGPFVEIAVTNPAFEESAMFDKMMDMVRDEAGRYERVVFDTAAVANAVRLIGLSKIYGLWLARMVETRKEALSIKVQLAFRKEKVMEEVKKDPLLADLLAMNEKFTAVRNILVDPAQTAFFFVTLPLALPISVVKRFIAMVRAYEIPIGGVVVNQVINRGVVEAHAEDEYLRKHFDEQLGYMRTIQSDLGELVSSYVPLYAGEVSGVEAVARLADDMFNFHPDALR